MIQRHRDSIAPPPEKVPAAPERDRQQVSPRVRQFLWVFSIIMVITAGSAFLMKLVEFLYEFSRSANVVDGGAATRPRLVFAISPLLTYMTVAVGFACLFLWAYFSGQFKNVEEPKYRMLQMQDEIDREEDKSQVSRSKSKDFHLAEH